MLEGMGKETKKLCHDSTLYLATRDSSTIPMKLSDLLIVLRTHVAIRSRRSLDVLVKPLFPLLGTKTA